MLGNRYIVTTNCCSTPNGAYFLQKGDILYEVEGYNRELEIFEDAKEENSLIHQTLGFICDAGSDFAKEHLELISQSFSIEEINQIKYALEYLHDADLSDLGQENIKAIENLMLKLDVPVICSQLDNLEPEELE